MRKPLILFILTCSLINCSVDKTDSMKSDNTKSDRVKLESVLESNDPFFFDWSPSPDTLIGIPGRDVELYDLKAKKKVKTLISYNNLDDVTYGISWFPSTKILFAPGYEYNRTIYLADSEIKKPKKIIPDGANPVWFQRNRSFVFDTSNSVNWIGSEVWLYDLTSKNKTKIGNGFYPSTDHRRFIVFCGLEGLETTGLFLYDLEKKSLRQLTRNSDDGPSSIDLNGETIVFIRSKQLWKIELKSNKEMKILDQNCFYPRISPFDHSIWVWIEGANKTYQLVNKTFAVNRKF